MRCPAVRLRLPRYVEGSLDRRASLRVARHLTTCSDCRREQQKLSVLAGAISSLPVLRCSPTFAATVLTRARAAEVVVPAPGAWGFRLAVAGAAAAMIAAIVFSPGVRELMRPGARPPDLAARRPSEELVLPVATPEAVLAASGELRSLLPSEGHVRVSFVLDQNVAPLVSTESVYVLDRARSWNSSRQETF